MVVVLPRVERIRRLGLPDTTGKLIPNLSGLFQHGFITFLLGLQRLNFILLTKLGDGYTRW